MDLSNPCSDLVEVRDHLRLQRVLRFCACFAVCRLLLLVSFALRLDVVDGLTQISFAVLRLEELLAEFLVDPGCTDTRLGEERFTGP